MSDLNLNNVFVSDSGRVQFSGAKSGIDFIDVVDKMVEARRVPAVTMESSIKENDTTKAALEELQTKLTTLQSALEELYGKASYDGSSDLFESKLAYASTSRTDGGTASAAGNLLGVTVTNNATSGNRTVEIQQIAASQRLASSSYAGTTTDAVGVSGTISLNTASGTQQSIDVLSTDSLSDIRDRINATTDNTGITATVVQASSTESYLVLNSDKEGLDNRITTLSDTGNVLSTLGLDNSGGITSSTVTGGTLTEDLTLMVNGTEYSYTAGQNLTDIETDLTAAGVTASVASDQLTITGTSDVHEKSGSIGLSVAGQLQGAQNAELVVDGLNTVVERSTNTISDVLDGVTMNLYDAEVGTTIKLQIEEDTSTITTALQTFVDAYNEVQQFINEQTYVDPSSGEVGEDAKLYGNSTVGNIESILQNIVGGLASGVDSGKNYATLASIGIDFVERSTSDATKQNTLEIDSTKLAEALANDVDQVRNLFAFDFTSDNPDVVLLGFDGNTQNQSGGYSFELNFDGSGDISSGTVDGNASAFSGSGSTFEANSNSNADGLRMLYTGAGTASETVNVNVTVGVGAQLFFALDSVLEEKTGSIATEIDNLTDQNDAYQDRIDDLDERLVLYREGLLDRFIAMETALSTMESTMSSLEELMGGSSS